MNFKTPLEPVRTYCHICSKPFEAVLENKANGDFLLECPTCDTQHYHFLNEGQVIHRNQESRHYEPATCTRTYSV